MSSEEKRMHLRQLRAHLDEHCPGWRDCVNEKGTPATKIECQLFLPDGELVLVLHQKPDCVTEDTGGA